MHRVVEAHTSSFGEHFCIQGNSSKKFEAFVNYVIFRKFSSDKIDPNDLVYDGDDPGIDGILIFVDDVFSGTVDEFKDLIKSKKNAEVDVVFLQSKTSEAWEKKEITNFSHAVSDFVSENPKLPMAQYLRNAREIFDLVIKNVGRIKGGKPKVSAFYATTAQSSNDREILSAIEVFAENLRKTGLFNSTVVNLLDRERLIELWEKAEGPVEANIECIAYAPFPKAPGLKAAYVATMKAKEFVDKMLLDENGNLRQRIFEENVRDFVGLDKDVNAEIGRSIEDSEIQKRFGILNNGVTVVASDARVQGNNFHIRDFQIVNGCQTSNVLFEKRNKISKDATIMLKSIEVEDNSLIDEVVRSTNRQTKVEDDQFLGLLAVLSG